MDRSTEHAAQRLLFRVAASALAGRVIDGDEESLGIAARHLPLDAQTMVRKLPTMEMSEICDEMNRLVKRTPVVTRSRRVAMATIMAWPLFFAVLMGFVMIVVGHVTKQQPEIIARPQRARAEKMMARPTPSPDELEQAKRVVQPILARQPRMEEVTSGSPVHLALYVFVLVWFVFVAIAALAAALIIRRGPIMRMFGVECVACTSSPASRGRMLWRSVIFNVALLFVPVLLTLTYSSLPGVTDLVPLIIIFLVLGVACWSCLMPQRGLLERLSGTYLVPTYNLRLKLVPFVGPTAVSCA